MKDGVKKLAERFDSGAVRNASRSGAVDTSVDQGLASANTRRALWKFDADAAAAAEQRRLEAESLQLARELQAQEQLEADLEFARQLEAAGL